jgi:hypothetical protein
MRSAEKIDASESWRAAQGFPRKGLQKTREASLKSGKLPQTAVA